MGSVSTRPQAGQRKSEERTRAGIFPIYQPPRQSSVSRAISPALTQARTWRPLGMDGELEPHRPTRDCSRPTVCLASTAITSPHKRPAWDWPEGNLARGPRVPWPGSPVNWVGRTPRASRGARPNSAARVDVLRPLLQLPGRRDGRRRRTSGRQAGGVRYRQRHRVSPPCFVLVDRGCPAA